MSFGFNTGSWMHSWMGRQDPGLPFSYVNEKDQEIIGVKDAVLFWITNYGTGTNSAAGGGFTATTFDVTSYSDGAIVKLNNDSGGDRKMKAACIYGKPVVRYSGDKSFDHNEFVDYDSIIRDGEKKLEFGNNYIVTKAQLESLCDHYWKANNYKRHTYELEIPGRCYWFCPGEWYTVQIGAAGQPEYIDSVCECYDVQIEAEAGGLGRSVVAFREVYQNWTKDSGALARFLGSGSPKDKYNFSRVLVASQYYPGPSDFRCDGTADQTEIQAAIDQVAGAGGGVVELTEGTFNTTAAIDLSYDNVQLIGAGAKTVFDKNGNDYAIKVVGASDDYITGVQIRNLKVTRNSSDANANDLIYLQYATNCVIEAVTVVGIYDPITGNDADNSDNIYLDTCTYCNILGCSIENGGDSGLKVTGSHHVIATNTVRECLYGMHLDCDDTIINANVVTDCTYYGIHISNGDRNQILGNSAINNGSLYSAPGIRVLGGRANLINGNYCGDNGNIILYGVCEGVNLPQWAGDTPYDSTASTHELSTEQFYGGAKSLKLTLTGASTGEYRFVDNINKDDKHDLTVASTMCLSAYTYLLSTGSPTTGEVKLIIGYTTAAAGAWHETTGNVSTEKDAWALSQTTNVVIPGSAVGFKTLIRINSAASTDECIFVDNIRMKPLGSMRGGNFDELNTTGTYGGL